MTQAGFDLNAEFLPDSAQPLRIASSEGEPSTDNATAVAATLRTVVGSSVDRSLQIEKDRVIKAAKTEDNFTAWVQEFYPKWIETSTVVPQSRGALIAHAADSKKQLLDVAASSTASSLAGAVSECVATWTDTRGQTITDTVMEQTNE